MANKVECDRCHRIVNVNTSDWRQMRQISFSFIDSDTRTTRDICESCGEQFFIFMAGKPTVGVK